jgi:hypothetical protein
MLVNRKKKDKKHGRYGYQTGCRCEVCIDAQRTYAREYTRSQKVVEILDDLTACDTCGRSMYQCPCCGAFICLTCS